MDSQMQYENIYVVRQVAEFSFGPEVSHHPFLVQFLPQISSMLVALMQSCHESVPVSIKDVLSIPDRLGFKVKGKNNPFKLFVTAAFIHLLYWNNVHGDIMYRDIATLLWRYPKFVVLSVTELSRLLIFRNYMAIAVLFIEPKNNKSYLLDLVTRLSEGFQVKYVTGSGATTATLNRVQIYEAEGCVHKAKRPLRHDSKLQGNNERKAQAAGAAEAITDKSIAFVEKQCLANTYISKGDQDMTNGVHSPKPMLKMAPERDVEDTTTAPDAHKAVSTSENFMLEQNKSTDGDRGLRYEEPTPKPGLRMVLKRFHDEIDGGTFPSEQYPLSVRPRFGEPSSNGMQWHSIA